MTSGKNSQSKGCVVIVADDMGKSTSVNRAIAEAHDHGILTAASIMAGGEAFDDAVQTALAHRRLSIGLHLTLCDGKAVLPHASLPDITDHDGNFIKDPFSAGLHYTRPGLLSQIEAEVAAQFERLEGAGIRPHHVDGHHHLHMHPVIFEVLCRQASRRDICWIRLPNESLSMVKAFRSPSRGSLPFVEWAVFGMLGKYNAGAARKFGMLSAARVFGLSRSGNIDEQFFLDILGLTGSHISEIFTHPDTATPAGRRELSALVSPRVFSHMKELHKLPVGYKDFTAPKKILTAKRRCSENIYRDIIGDLECRNR
ncbi:MAG TPA: ChbG/HpnK family deacetylase [Dissulfurispiraceae bacterium]|nr:ChbG/HpnK family deacetylase [Dissulfurispiraceae bacterium]